MKKQQLLGGVALILALVSASDATAQAPRQQLKSDPARAALIDRTEAALLEQIKCQQTLQVGRAINAMLQNRLIRYVDNESGIYLFKPNVPMAFLGLTIRYISGFYLNEGFENVPGSRMLGTEPPVFLEIEVAASASELRKRALDAGLVEGVPSEDKRGFEVSVSTEGYGSYLAPKHSDVTSSITCVDYPVLRRGS